jgi:hypothetical protein
VFRTVRSMAQSPRIPTHDVFVVSIHPSENSCVRNLVRFEFEISGAASKTDGFVQDPNDSRISLVGVQSLSVTGSCRDHQVRAYSNSSHTTDTERGESKVSSLLFFPSLFVHAHLPGTGSKEQNHGNVTIAAAILPDAFVVGVGSTWFHVD